MVGLIWHATPSRDLCGYAGLEKTKAAFMDVGTVPFGYGNPSTTTPAATPKTRRAHV